MIGTIDDAARDLLSNARGLQARLEMLAETAYSLGDQSIAETLAQQASDVAYVLPQISKLEALPEEDEPLSDWSDSPTRDERGMRLVFFEALEMLETARHWQALAGSRIHNPAAANQVAAIESVVRRVRSLCNLAVDKHARIAGQ